ncbi:uncharacterized protein [Eleutherodactylus coqui]|uniref:uncharacterized protein n=1 Tax=Eleutherodactylus coqui TaxID=57060 RepID=UPI0034619CF3
METWIQQSDSTSPAALSYDGLQFSHTPRSDDRCSGGVAIILSPNCTFQVIPSAPSLTFHSFEVHTLRLFRPLPLRVAVIYRPPGPTRLFLDHFAAWLPHFLSCEIPTLILGDFNIPTNDSSSSSDSRLLTLTSSLGLSLIFDSPTHRDGNTLDLVFLRLCSASHFTNSPLAFSDHNLLSFSIRHPSISPDPPIYRTCRNLQSVHTKQFAETIQSSPSPISRLPCPNLAAEYYHTTLSRALDEAAPPVTRAVKRRPRQPWLMSQTRFIRRCSRCAERLWRKSKLPADFLHFKFMLKTYNLALHHAKQVYFTSLVSSLSHNPKQLFETFHSLLSPKEQAPVTDLTAGELAAYFKEKIDNIQKEICESCMVSPDTSFISTAPSTYSLSTLEPTTDEVSRLLSTAPAHFLYSQTLP